MKTIFALTFLTALTATATTASAQLFDPDFSGPGAPTGYTTTTAGSGTVSFSGGTMTVGDFSDNATQAYIQGSSAVPMNETFTTDFTFTPNFTYTPNGGGQGNISVFQIGTTDANNSLFSVVLQPFRYSSSDNVNLGSGIGFGTAPSSNGSASYSSPTVGSLSGVALTIHDVTTSTDDGPSSTPGNGDHWSVENKGTISANGSVVLNFDFTSDGDTLNPGPGEYDPAANPLTLKLGIIGVSNDGPTAPATNSYFAPGASIAFSDVSIIAGVVPEPSTYALFLGGFGALALIARRRVTA